MDRIKTVLSTEERVGLIINDLLEQCEEARQKCIERGNYEKAARRDAQLEILDELIEKMAARGLVVLEGDLV